MLVTNWVAALKLPFVYIGLAKDFWRDFDDRYLELEKGLPSTFFVIPFKNYSGKRVTARRQHFVPLAMSAKDIARHDLQSESCGLRSRAARD